MLSFVPGSIYPIIYKDRKLKQINIRDNLKTFIRLISLAVILLKRSVTKTINIITAIYALVKYEKKKIIIQFLNLKFLEKYIFKEPNISQ